MSTRSAVILAAGVGSRLRPLTDDRPKALVEVAGRSILSRAVDALAAHGVSRLVVATGYRADAVERALRGAPMEVLFRPNPHYASTQNSVSLALCRDALVGQAFFRLDGDLVFVPEILSRLAASAAPLVAAVDRGRALDAEAMKVRLAADGGRIAAFGKGIPPDRAAGESIGVERISEGASGPLFDALERAGQEGEFDLYYEDVYSRLIDAGLIAEMADVTGLAWSEVDTSSDLEVAERLFGA